MRQWLVMSDLWPEGKTGDQAEGFSGTGAVAMKSSRKRAA